MTLKSVCKCRYKNENQYNHAFYEFKSHTPGQNPSMEQIAESRLDKEINCPVRKGK